MKMDMQLQMMLQVVRRGAGETHPIILSPLSLLVVVLSCARATPNVKAEKMNAWKMDGMVNSVKRNQVQCYLVGEVLFFNAISRQSLTISSGLPFILGLTC